MTQKSGSDPIPSLRGIDVLKIKSTVKGQWYYLQYQGEKFRSTEKPLGSWRLVCNKVGVFANKKEFKEPYWKKQIGMERSESNWVLV